METDAGQEPVEFEALPPSTGVQVVAQPGNVRRVVFEAPRRPEPAQDPSGPNAGPAPEAPEPAAGVPMQSIHDEVDRLGSRSGSRPSLANTTPVGTRASSSVLYRTRHGAVTETRLSDGARERRLLYVSTLDDRGHERVERFSSELVDRIVKDVKLDAPGLESTGPAIAGESDARSGDEADVPLPPQERDYRFVQVAQPGDMPWEPSSTADGDPDQRRSAPLEGRQDSIPELERPAVAHQGGSALRTSENRARWSAGKSAGSAGKPATKAGKPRARPRTTRPSTFVGYPGDDHEVVELEGIGETFAKRLRKAGVHTTHRLCYEDATRLARRIKVPAKTIRTWQAQAELIKVKGIGKQFAEALARAGIRGIDELKERSPAALSAQVASYLDSLDSNVLGTGITAARVKAWQAAARRLRKRKLPVPPKGAEFETVRGHVRKLKQRQPK